MADPWFKDGLRFECTQCGKCCGGSPGFVWVNDQEISEIAEFLNEPVEAVFGVYTRREGTRRSLREKNNYDCVFYDREKGCTIYPVRPRQCRTWPFWDSNTKTAQEWDRTAESCPGCNQGDLIPSEEILKRIAVIRI